MNHKRTLHLWHLFRGTGAYALLPLVGLITAPLLARTLGPSGRGELAAVLQPLAVADAVLLAGVPTAVTYFVGRHYAFRQIRRPVLIVTACSGIVTIAAMAYYSGSIASLTGIDRRFIAAIWMSSLIGLLIAIRRAILQGQGKLGILDVERALFAILRLTFIVALVAIGVTAVENYIIAYVLPGLVVALVLLMNTKNEHILPSSEKLTRTRFKPSAFYAFTALAGAGHIASTLNSRLDQALLPVMLSVTELGLYSVAVTLAEVPLILSMVTSRNLLTLASKGSSTGTLRQTSFMGLGLVIIVALSLWIAAPSMTTLLFGQPFSSSADLVRILLLGTVFAAAASFSSVILAGTGHPGLGAVSPSLGVACLIVGLLAFSDVMDAHMAAVIVVVSRLICCLSSLLLVCWASRRARKKSYVSSNPGA